jgi:N utilization substance protein A
MSPAIISAVEIIKDENGEAQKAIITLPSDQKSTAIGKSGINIRLASMLSGLNIELVESDSKNSQNNEAIEPKEQKDGVDALKALFS